MITTFLRSSSYGAFDFCQHSFFLKYVLNLPDSSNKAATKGNIVHKALELIAHLNPVIRQDVIKDDIGNIKTNSLLKDDLPNYTMCLDIAFQHYLDKTKGLFQWTQADYVQCVTLLDTAIKYNEGEYNPFTMPIKAVEKFFEFEIDEDWANYEYNINGNCIKGKLGLKGTVDVVLERNNNIEIVDWKTGAKKDWATGKAKTYETLQNDPQLKLYHYALHKIFNVTDIFFTIFFLATSEPFTIPFSSYDLDDTKLMIKRRFEEIKNTTIPKTIIDNPSENWKCSRLCHFGKNIASEYNSDKTICGFFADEIKTYGIDNVTNKFCDSKKLLSYGSGGGRV